MKRVYSARTLAEAHLMREHLAAEGIQGEVFGEHSSGLWGEIPLTIDNLPAVWVLADDDYDRAREIVLAFEEEHGESREEPGAGDRVWICGSCSEENPANFESCWNCGGPSNPRLVPKRWDGDEGVDED